MAIVMMDCSISAGQRCYNLIMHTLKKIIFISMNLKNDIAIFFLAIVCCIGCLHEPVDSDYYDDLSLVKGGEKPTPPVDLSLTVADHKVILQFYTDRLDNGNPVTYDPDTGTNENLYYLVYIASQDPATFDDPELYYDNTLLSGVCCRN